MNNDPTKTSPNPPALPESVVAGRGLHPAARPEDEMPPMYQVPGAPGAPHANDVTAVEIAPASSSPQFVEDQRRAQGEITPLDDMGRPVSVPGTP